jgi:hypothetical protein
MDVEIEMQDKPKRNLKILKKPLNPKKCDFAEFVETEPQKEIKTNTNFLLIANIENIYLNIKQKNPFRKMSLVLVFIFFFSQTLLWHILHQMNDVKSNYYCFNPQSTYFESCDMKKYCRDAEKGLTNIFFVNKFKNDTIYNVTKIEEINNVNKIFRYYYLKEYFHFSVKNLDKLDKIKSYTNYYSTIVIVNYAEDWNMFLTFRQCCSKERDIIILGVFVLIGLVLGSLVLGFLADVFGRRPVLNFIIFLQIIGCLGVFLFSFFVLKSGEEMIKNFENFDLVNFSRKVDNQSPSQNIPILKQSGINWEIISNSEVKQIPFLQIEGDNIFKFTEPLEVNLDYEYSQNFRYIIQMLLKNKTISYNYNHYKFILFFFFFVISYCISSGLNISLSLILETSTNDRLIYRSYFLVYVWVHFILFISLCINND